MSLNWSLSKIPNWETVCQVVVTQDDPNRDLKVGDKALAPLTNVLIWQTMAVGLGDITDANHAEFYARLKIVEGVMGPFLYDANGGVRKIKLAEVRAHIGLHTNVSKETASQFLAKITQAIISDARWAEQVASRIVATSSH